MNRLRGKRITGPDGPIGVLDDLYFDASAWSVRYLALEPLGCNPGRLLIISAASARINGIGDEELVLGLKHRALGRNHAIEANLMSAREASALRLQTEDGPAGMVVDVLIGIDWSIAGFLVASRSWVLPGSPVELAPGAVSRLDRERRVLCVKLTREEIQRLPRAAWRVRR